MKTTPMKLTTLLTAAILLVACAQVGLAPAEGFDQKLAYGYSTVAAVRTTAAQALTAGTITSGDAKQALATTDTARTALDAASAANETGDKSTAMGKLTLATELLTQIQQYLQSKGAK